MLLVTGKLDKISEREAGNAGNTWIEQTLILRDWGQTLYVTASRDLVEAGLPKEGDMVALNVAVRGYVRKDKGDAGIGYTALSRNVEAESALFPGKTSSGVRAVS